MSIQNNLRETGSTEISRDQWFSMLSNQRRRWVLRFLGQQDTNQVEFRRLVKSVSAWEYDTDPDKTSWKQRKRVYTALRQSHLPKLDQTGVINYDQNRGTVELTESAQRAQLFLEDVPKDEIPWNHYYLSVACVSTVLIVLMQYSVGPFGGLSGMALASTLIAVVGLTAIVHTHKIRQRSTETEHVQWPRSK